MATPVTRYWTGSVNTLWSHPFNWDTVPGGTGSPGLPTDIDNVVFNGTGVVNCRMDTAIHVASLDCQSGYTGHLDAATDDLNHYIAGDCTLKAGGTVSCGDGTWTVDGDFSNYAVGTWNRNLSTFQFRGTNNTIESSNSAARFLYKAHFLEGAYYKMITANFGNYNDLKVWGTLDLDTFRWMNLVDTYLKSTGAIIGTATSELMFQGQGAGRGLVECAGLMSPGLLSFFGVGAGAILEPGNNWDCNVEMYPYSSGTKAIELKAGGVYDITGDLHVYSPGAGNITLNNAANGPASIRVRGDMKMTRSSTGTVAITQSGQATDWYFHRDFVPVGTISWTKGNGSIYAVGTDHDFDFDEFTIEDLKIQASGTVTFLDGWTSDSFSATSGTLDFNQGVETYATVGIWEIDGAQVDGDSLNNGEWDVGTNLYLYGDPNQDGTLMDLVGSAAWEIAIGLTAIVEKVDVAYCDLGVDTITAYYSKDSGNNTGWTFDYDATARTMDELMVLFAPNQVKAISSQDLRDFLLSTGLSPKVKHTDIGGLAVKMTNRTGAVSEAGRLVEASSSYDSAVDIVAANGVDCIGAFLDSGVADGSEAWIVIAGICDVLLEDNTGTTRDYWVKVSDTEAGYADGTNSAPPGGTITNIQDHFSEIGHALQNISAGGVGTHQLARIILHFN